MRGEQYAVGALRIHSRPPPCLPAVLVRRRSPLWDQEDMYQREGCGTVNAVSMPFYWPPAANTQFEGAALPIPQNPAYHPTFGAMTVGSPRPLTQQ